MGALLRRIVCSLIVASGALGGCAPKGYFYETGSFVARPRDACALPEVAADFISVLNQRVGQRDGPTDVIVSVQGLAAPGFIVEPKTQLGSCHGALTLARGQSESGTITVLERNGERVVRASWESDAAVENRRVEQQRTAAETGQNANVPKSAVDEKAVIEKDAVLFSDTSESLAFIDKLVKFVRANDFTCDSVSAQRPMLTARGYVLVCNKFSYTYDIQDKGGHWVASVR
jgi:hypothetical protein